MGKEVQIQINKLESGLGQPLLFSIPQIFLFKECPLRQNIDMVSRLSKKTQELMRRLTAGHTSENRFCQNTSALCYLPGTLVITLSGMNIGKPQVLSYT